MNVKDMIMKQRLIKVLHADSILEVPQALTLQCPYKACLLFFAFAGLMYKTCVHTEMWPPSFSNVQV